MVYPPFIAPTCLTEHSLAFARAMIPEFQDTSVVNPLIISAYDVSVVADLNPKGKVNTLSVPS